MRETSGLAYTGEEIYSRVRRVSWGAIIAGAVIAVVTQITLSLIGLGIGIGAINPYAANPMEGIGVGALIWWVLSNLISIFIGAWFASRLAGIPKTGESVMNSMVTFGVYTLLSFYILTSAIGGILGGVGTVIGQSMHMAGSTVNLSVEDVERLIREGQQAIEGETGQMDQETRDELRYHGQQATQIGSQIGIFLGIGLVLGAVAAAAGGKLGETHDLYPGSPGPGTPGYPDRPEKI
jgi:ElaB/YqjD/DUF883 family membrane-anchored ribosome-binding protein